MQDRRSDGTLGVQQNESPAAYLAIRSQGLWTSIPIGEEVPAVADILPPTPTDAYPKTLTEVERVEIASALSFHFDNYECREELEAQYQLVCVVVERMMRRRAA